MGININQTVGKVLTPPFSPADVPNISAWYKWDAGVLNNSDLPAVLDDPVKSWLDQIGSVDVSQANPAFRPIFKNTHLQFDGAAQWLLATTGDIQVNGGATFILWEGEAGSLYAGDIDLVAGGANDGQIFRENGEVSPGVSSQYRMYAGAFANQITYTYGQMNVTSLLYLGADAIHRKNGVPVGPANTGTNSGTGISIGARREGDRAFKGKIKEVIVYSVAPDGTNLTNIESYLAARALL